MTFVTTSNVPPIDMYLLELLTSRTVTLTFFTYLTTTFLRSLGYP